LVVASNIQLGVDDLMSKTNSTPAIVIATAGLGTTEFLSAGKRVIRQAQGFRIFTDYILLTTRNLPELCPLVNNKYSDYLNSSTRGFGFMSWKAELANKVLTENSGNVLYLWVDAGCELFPSVIGKFKLKNYLQLLQRDGYLYFTLDTPESAYTKVGLFNYFPSLLKDDTTPQAQTTFFGLYGEIGQTIAQRWLSIVVSNIETVNEQNSYAWDGSRVEHRHDQSVFSLVLKEMGLKANINPLKSNRNSSPILNRLKYLTQPILASRNRTGTSVREQN
jgi:hypothetical protein